MPKYRDTFRQMISEHESEFAAFKQVHDLYNLDKKTNQQEFNLQGEKIVLIIRDYERLLCSSQERGNKGVFSTRLADMFWKEVKAFFPLIDFVGVEIS
jgi:hypothetical protein